jgi:hypothetical protein
MTGLQASVILVHLFGAVILDTGEIAVHGNGEELTEEVAFKDIPGYELGYHATIAGIVLRERSRSRP